eukprot:g8862.t1
MATIWALFSCAALLLNPALGRGGDSSKGYDADLTLFSPEGRLYQVEYVMRAVGHYGCPVVGVQGEGCCVVACKRDVLDELVYPDSVSNIFRITDDICSAATGLSGDVRYQVKRARLQALEYKRQYGSPMPSRLLALAMADAAQVNTQHAALRPMACVSFVISVDDPTGPVLFRVEPSGQVFQTWGTAAGRGSAASVEFLEEAYQAANAVAVASEQGRPKREGEPTTPTKSKKCDGIKGGQGEGEEGAFSDSESADEDSLEGGHTTPSGEAEDNTQEVPTTSRRDSETAIGTTDHASGDHDDRGNIVAGGWDSGSDTAGNTAEPPDGSGTGERMVGFGVVGEGETVELALQALRKVSSDKDAPPMTDKNVEIAIASRDTGIRVCSRKEVKGFLGKMAIYAECAPSKFGR